MDKISILQLGDVHFDTPFKGLSNAKSSIRKEEIRETFKKSFEFADKNEVKFVLIPGDLFDNDRVSRESIQFIINVLNKYPGINVIISPGNHDPYNEKSFYNLINWPKNVFIISSEYEKISFPEYNLDIYGSAFLKSHQRETLLNFSAEDLAKINILVMHGDVDATEGSLYNPINKEEIENSRMDYIAFGHKHSFSQILKAGDTSYAYSGCIEPRNFNETGDKGVILLEISKGDVSGRFVKMSKREYINIDMDITGCTTNDMVAERIIDTTDSKEEEFICLNLKGETDGFYIKVDVLQEKLKRFFFNIDIKDNTKPKLDLDSIRKEETLKGIFIRNLLRSDDKCANEAIKFGLMALEGEDIE